MPRRRKRKPLSDEQIKERRRKDKNFNTRKRYALKQKILFYIEYEKLCKKYGCFVQCLYGPHIKKHYHRETIYTLSSHLDSVQRSIEE